MTGIRATDVAVIGAGPAGLAAAVAAVDKGANVLLLERDARPGGILQQCVHNGFGLHYFGEELTGPEYAARFAGEAARRADRVSFLPDTMALSLDSDRTITAVSPREGPLTIKPGAVVLAMGCRERARGALGIAGTRPAGVYTAGAAQRLVNLDGYLPGRRVVILGSGDIGLIMARRLTWEGAKVLMVCELMPYSSGLNRNIVQCLRDYDIPLYFNTTVSRVHGSERVEAVTVVKVDGKRQAIPGTERVVECDTLLLSVGLMPENELTRMAGIQLDPVTGGAVVDERRQTSLPGVFACGNVLQVHDLVDHVSREAEIAGRYAAGYAKAGTLPMPKLSVSAEGFTRYVVPQRISAEPEGMVDLYFRVGDAVKPARLTVRTADGKTILTRRKKAMTPGEMEHVKVDVSKLTGDVVVVTEAVGNV
ncbi:MAG: FAD-dependent oxidoreductase [Oscillospiraceae bacterium]|jgi:NADPH-dependent 2,4-dienoyl-CoA reductase/sulfur reductase-like enzyme|nr:FAD-dependent oxidoreductase [Oscillospiraceae bacterium]